MRENVWLRQLGALIIKEFKEIKRDPSSWLVAFILPLIFLLLFGYGITLDAGRLSVAILNQSGGPNSLSLTSAFAHSPWFFTTSAKSMKDAGEMMSDSLIQGVVNIREDFDRKIAAGLPGNLQLLVDGSEPNTARFIGKYAQGLIENWTSGFVPGGVPGKTSINVEPRIWYNPAAESEKFLVPGSITVIMTLIGTLLTSLVFAREWERGTMEALLATPATKAQLLLGKLIPYFCMGMVSMILCVLVSITLFNIPFLGSPWALLLISSIFMLCALGQGLLISVCMKQQLVAAEAGLFTGFLPALLLSGFVFDIDSMVAPLQAFTKILPATWFNICIRTLFLAGDSWDVFLPCILYMTILASLLLALVYLKIPSRLPKS